jgi:hypothetical protein
MQFMNQLGEQLAKK